MDRERRLSKALFNAVLSLSYTLLYSEVVLTAYGTGLPTGFIS
ncbi:CRISPR-associated endonuclease Cas1 [Phocoenobacter skyensis]